MPRRGRWTADEVRQLGVVTNVRTAASILGISHTLAYELLAAGQFPTPVIHAGSRAVVPVAPLLRSLGVEPAEETRAVPDLAQHHGLDCRASRSVDRTAATSGLTTANDDDPLSEHPEGER
jgi:hypothetical protein